MRGAFYAAGVLGLLAGCSLVVDTGDLSGGEPVVPDGGGPTPNDSGGAPDRDEPSDAGGTDAGVDADAAPPVDPTLVADWAFDEGAGTIVHDVTGRGHDGTVVNGTWVAGRKGTAIAFEAADGDITVSNLSGFDRPANATFTITGWLKPKVAPEHWSLQPSRDRER